MYNDSFTYFAWLYNAPSPPGGPGILSENSRAEANTVYDTYDTSDDGVTLPGDNLYLSGTYFVPARFVGTTDNGIVLYYGGGYILLSNTAYTNGQSLSNFNSSNSFGYCFLGGTMIATPNDEIPVEYLKIGDMVRTADGRDVPVKWIGEQRVRNWMFTPETQTPVCIAKGALGDGLPHTDLFVSADHGMILDGHVINASALVNGSTIRFVPMAEMPNEFKYFHIETEEHDAVLANGAAAETFIDAANRKVFDNHQEYLDLYGAERIVPEMDRPRIASARMVPDCVKARLGPAADWSAALDDPGMTIALQRGA